jgi:hypothetical protein
MTLQVSPDLVRPVIEQKIQAAIVAALAEGKESAMLSAIVGRVLAQKVDSEGKVSRYDSYNDREYVRWLCETAIRDCARRAVQEWAESNKAKIEKQMQAELSRRSAGMAKVFMDGLLKSMQSSWTFKVDVGFESPKER